MWPVTGAGWWKAHRGSVDWMSGLAWLGDAWPAVDTFLGLKSAASSPQPWQIAQLATAGTAECGLVVGSTLACEVTATFPGTSRRPLGFMEEGQDAHCDFRPSLSLARALFL